MAGARVGADCNLGGHVFIESGAVVGDRVIVKNQISIWDRVTTEDEVFLGPNAVFTNDRVPRAVDKTPPEEFLPTRVRRGASIGANATLVCGVTIGEWAVLGAGSVVVRDVPAPALVVGNPAHRTAWVCACGEKLGEDLACGCGHAYSLVSPSAGLAPRSPA